MRGKSKVKRTVTLILLLLTMLMPVSCGDSDGIVDPIEEEEGGISYVEMEFENYGKIVIKVDGEEAPITAANFMKLVRDGFYDGLTIFRAQANFVIQGGEDKSVNLKPIAGEFSENGYDNNIVHNRGVISMARTNDPNSATSQFFITLDDGAKYSLDGKYAGFGYVIEGMDVVDSVAAALISAPSSGYMGFVGDSDAIKIKYAKELKDYTESDGSEDNDNNGNNVVAPAGISYVEMEFENYGKIVIKVDGDEAPITATNFMKLVKDGYYDGLTIFRAQQNFVIQGGEGEGTLDPIVGEFAENGYKNNISHLRGVISMARTNESDSATSQFFISLHDSVSSALDGKYAGFGYVIEGMSVVDSVAAALIAAPSSGYMGFVGDEDAIKITYAKHLPDYKEPEAPAPKVSYVEMEFENYGKVVMKIDGFAAPVTAANFMALVNQGFYDGLTVFRAQADFVIQGGKSETVNVTPIKGEFALNGYQNSISHLRGVLSMARSTDYNSATSQFFVTLNDSAANTLDGKYAAFGYVIEGMDVVDAVAAALIAAPSSGDMGFVADGDAIKITYAKEIEIKNL